MNETKPMSEFEYDDGGKRTDEDLDSISYGSDSTQKGKLYYNSRVDTEENLLPRIDILVASLMYMKTQFEKHGLTKQK